MARLSLPPTATDYYLLATTPRPARQTVVIFFEWDLEKLKSADVELEELLKSPGVTQQWLGPPRYDIPIGGHAYLGKAQVQLEDLPCLAQFRERPDSAYQISCCCHESKPLIPRTE